MKSATSIWSRIADVAGLVATPLVPSHYLALVSPLAATHVLKARVEAVADETADCRTLVLRPGRGWRPHQAGQHVRVGVELDGRIATRMFSISSSPERDDGCITITVKAQGKVSTALVRTVEPGTYLTLGAPEGEFVYTDSPRALFVTAGSGITPVASMLRTFAARGEMPDVVHLHYAQTPDDVIFGAELRALAARFPSYRLVERYTRLPRPLASARYSTEQLTALVPDWRTREAWACGPQGLLDALDQTFAAVGRTLHVERFTARLAAPETASSGLVRFGKSRVDAISDGKTPLLQLAEAAGVAAPHGCRMGICHTCDATLTRGCVRDLRTGERIDEPGSRIQICVCAAAGDVALDV